MRKLFIYLFKYTLTGFLKATNLAYTLLFIKIAILLITFLYTYISDLPDLN